MANAHNAVVLRQIDRLYREGTLAGLPDGQLLERYVTRRDEAAFEALVNQHGPMVLGLCRRMLRDPRDVEDAFQATFLILVRKASGIRDPSHLSNWLYGVAYRIAVRARANTIRRRGRETAIANRDVAAVPDAMNLFEIGPVLDQELNRLPRKYRAVLVLCYLKARTHDQAAEELCCPVGTVRSRLSRGRDLLKRRLTRRGVSPTAAILGSGTSVPAQFLSEAVPPSLVSATVRTALGFSSFKTISAGAAGASATALTQGVLMTMKLAKLKWIGLAVLATGLSTGVVAVSSGSPQDSAGSIGPNQGGVGVKDRPRPSDGKPIADPSGGSPTDHSEERIKELESQVATLTAILRATGTANPIRNAKSNDPFRPATDTSRTDPEVRGTPTVTNAAIRELEIQLKRELREYDMHEHPPLRLDDDTRDAVLETRAILEGLRDDLADEIARLDLEIKRRHAELTQVFSQKEVATSLVARNARLNERKAGMISAEDTIKAEAELDGANAAVTVKAVVEAELGLRTDQLRRRYERIDQLIKLAERVKGLPTPKTSPTPAGGNSRR